MIVNIRIYLVLVVLWAGCRLYKVSRSFQDNVFCHIDCKSDRQLAGQIYTVQQVYAVRVSAMDDRLNG